MKAKPLFPINPKGLDDVARDLLVDAPEPETPPAGTGTPPAPAIDITNPENYIVLPGKKHGSYEYPNILVSKVLEYHNSNWLDCKTNLDNEDSFMLTIRQFADFLKLLRNGDVNVRDGNNKIVKKDECKAIYNEITEVRDPYRAEWLDAKFTKQGNDFYINYNILGNNSLNRISEKLEDCVMSDKQIDLSDYLARANSQGLPIPATKSGSLYYWCPVDGAVAGFWANLVRADLDCDRDPSDTVAGLGVRRAKKLRSKTQ